MITLSSKRGRVISPSMTEPFVIRASSNEHLPDVMRSQHLFLVSDKGEVAEGFKAYVCFDEAHAETLKFSNVYCLPPQMSHLSDGDIVRLNPTTGGARIMYRRKSCHNAFLVTERCNSFCIMCSQPPRDVEDDYLAKEIEEAIPLIDRGTPTIGLTGGEPTLLGDRFLRLVSKFKLYLPETALHILTNGRSFSNLTNVKRLADIRHPDLMLGIPIYSDVSNIHDFVVQARGAYDETVRGILNLKACGVRVEVRIVVHKQTYDRLPQLAEFICRNLTFVDHVAFMGLEITGFTKVNLDALWIDPVEYQAELASAVHLLDRFRIKTSIYNHQLCLLDPSLYEFNVKSISDWKNEYMPECSGCTRMNDCGGFFSSAKLRYSRNIRPFN